MKPKLILLFLLVFNLSFAYNWYMYKCDTSGSGYNPVEISTDTKFFYIVSYSSAVNYSSVVEVDGILYVGSCEGEVLAFDVTVGKILWKKKLSSSIYSTVLVDDGVVYVGSSAGELYAFDALTGEIIWKKKDHNAIFTSLVVDESYLYLAYNGSKVVGISCVDKEDGRLVWQSWIKDYFLGSALMNGYSADL